MSHTICYTSKATSDLSEEEIQQIFEVTTSKNNAENIRGILLHGFGNFFQVLEGDEQVIVPLYKDHILKDIRHKDIFEIINKETPISVFSNYDSRFNIIRTSQELENIKTYFQKNMLESSTSDKLYRLLQPFII